jgi:hypothetical protein
MSAIFEARVLWVCSVIGSKLQALSSKFKAYGLELIAPHSGALQ